MWAWWRFLALLPAAVVAAITALAAEDASGEEPERPYAIDVTVRALTAYYDTGFLQERRGFVVQPEAEVSRDLWSCGRWSLGAFAGVFGSLHEQRTFSEQDGFGAHAYELTLWAGASVTWGRLSVSPYYEVAFSPSGAFDRFDSFELTIEYDDEGWAPRFSLQPSVQLSVETKNALDEVLDLGTFLGIGIEPTWAVAETCRGPLTLRFPAALGLSLGDYFQDASGRDDTFGFAAVGVFADVPLGRGPGEPTLEAGVLYYSFGHSLTEYNGRDDATVFSIGLVLGF